VPPLRTADDVFLLAAQRPDIGTTRPALHDLIELADRTDTGHLLSLRRKATTPAREITGIDVSASFLGRRTFTRYNAEDVGGPSLARRLGVPYHSRRTGAAPPPGCCGWRLTLDGTRATLMLRVDDRPLHRRAYKQHTVPGTLHPPLAAAMAALAGIRPGHTVLDPCRGAGTLLIEAALARPDARFHGYGLSVDAVAAARANAGGLPVAVRRSDAGRLPLPDAPSTAGGRSCAGSLPPRARPCSFCRTATTWPPLSGTTSPRCACGACACPGLGPSSSVWRRRARAGAAAPGNYRKDGRKPSARR
jgi:hypothetical protein